MLSRFIISGLGCFSVLLCSLFSFLLIFVDNLFSFWVGLELLGLAALPSLFVRRGGNLVDVYTGLLIYILVSGLSSVFIITGVIFSSLYWCVFWGFGIKLGLFPFMSWVYYLFLSSGWLFILLFSVVLKFPVLYFSFLWGCTNLWAVIYVCLFTLLVCSLWLWLYTPSDHLLWCHMSLSSVSTLVAASFLSDFFSCWFIFVLYSTWAVAVILYFCSGGISIYAYVFLLLVTPISFPLFYKFSVSVALFYSSIWLLVFWCVYNLSEQFFILKRLGDRFNVGVFNVWT